MPRDQFPEATEPAEVIAADNERADQAYSSAYDELGLPPSRLRNPMLFALYQERLENLARKKFARLN